MYKWIKPILILTIAVVAFVGCSTIKPDSNTGGENSGGPVEIKFWHGMSGQLKNVLDGQVEDFNKSQDEVRVSTVSNTDYDTNQQKLLAAIASDSQPDIAQIEIHAIPQFAASGSLVSLDDFMEQSEQHKKEDFVDGLLNNTQFEGETYGIPFNRSVPTFYYNADMFQEAGISDAPETWEDVQKYATKLAKPDEKIYGYTPVNEWWFYQSMVWSGGEEITNKDYSEATFDTPEAREGMEIWQGLKQDGAVNVRSGTEAWTQTISDFAEGRTAMYSGSAGDMGQIEDAKPEFEWKASYIPKFDEYAVPTGGANAAILSQDKEKQQAAWEFISWFTSTEQAVEWSKKTGYLPVKKAAVEDEKMAEYFEKNPNHKVPVDQLEYARTAPESPDYPEVLEAIQTGMDDILYNDKPVGPSLEKAEEKSTEILSGS
jgi:ABC-type glycerol-3-phosphate transport system substrate-binding protein